MAYNLILAERIRDELSGLPFVEKKMFGGVGYLLNGNMACGVNEEDLIVRVDPEKQNQFLEQPHTRVFDMTGRPMKGWLMIEPAGYEKPEQLKEWVKAGMAFALTLPAK